MLPRVLTAALCAASLLSTLHADPAPIHKGRERYENLMRQGRDLPPEWHQKYGRSLPRYGADGFVEEVGPRPYYPGGPAGQGSRTQFDSFAVDSGHSTPLGNPYENGFAEEDPNTRNPKPADGGLPPIIPYAGQASATYLGGGNYNITELDTRGTLVFPRLLGMAVTPGFNVNFFDAPQGSAVPDTLYGITLGFAWSKFPKPEEKWGFLASITPGWYSDFRTSDGAFRLQATALGFYRTSPTVQWSFGFVYLDRGNIPVLPAFGVLWDVSDDLKVELMIPRPRVAYRLSQNPDGEWWWYLVGEFGGGSWAVRRNTGVSDELTYNDLRLLNGWEYKRTKSCAFRLEWGLVFGRAFEWESNVGNEDPTDAILFRIVIAR